MQDIYFHKHGFYIHYFTSKMKCQVSYLGTIEEIWVWFMSKSSTTWSEAGSICSVKYVDGYTDLRVVTILKHLQMSIVWCMKFSDIAALTIIIENIIVKTYIVISELT